MVTSTPPALCRTVSSPRASAAEAATAATPSAAGGAGNGFTGSLSIAVGGSGGDAGSGGEVTVTNNATIVTSGDQSDGIIAQSVGSGGGDAGYAVAVTGALGYGGSSFDGDVSFALGGTGGGGGGADAVQVSNSGAITTRGDQSIGIMAQSLAGGGGNGGMSIAGGVNIGGNGYALGFSLGGSGGQSGAAGTVTVDNYANIQTGAPSSAVIEDNSTGLDLGAVGILAQSISGGGGNGGLSIGGAVNLSAGTAANPSLSFTMVIGGSGGDGNTAGAVSVTDNAAISTQGDDSYGILALSVGGGGGTGDLAVGDGFNLNNTNNPALALNISVGGDGGTGDVAGAVTVNQTGNITTLGEDATGILAQSIGGGGGDAGDSYAVNGTYSTASGRTLSGSITAGGDGGSGDNGGEVTVNNSTLGGFTISTSGDGADGIAAQSLGGGGGNGGDARSAAEAAEAPEGLGGEEGPAGGTLEIAVGGSGGASGGGGEVTVDNGATINTSGGDAIGILAQSIGGGGGTGGDADLGLPDGLYNPERPEEIFRKVSLTVGGQGGASGDGGAVDVTNSSAITTQGNGAYAIEAQSIGGGGGDAGTGAADLSVKLALSLGGGGSGNGNTVTINNYGVLQTYGAGASAIFAQSIGAGGGAAGDLSEGQKSGGLGGIITSAQFGITMSLTSGGAGDGGAVNVTNQSAITTEGVASDGIFAQSIGGGGGVAGGQGFAVGGFSAFAGSVGQAGYAGSVTVSQTGNITTTGDYSDGIFAQSQGGGAALDPSSNSFLFEDDYSGGAVTVNFSGAISATGQGSDGICAESSGDTGGSTISIGISQGSSVTGGYGASGSEAPGDDGAAGVVIQGGGQNTLYNDGTITAADDLAVVANAESGTVAGYPVYGFTTVVNQDMGVIDGAIQIGATPNGAFITGYGALQNAGVIDTLAGNGTGSQVNGNVTNTGSLYVRSDNFVVAGSYDQSGASAITEVDSNGYLYAAAGFSMSGGTLDGGGEVDGNVSVTGGQVLSGSTPQILTVGGNYAQSGGSIVFDISENSSGAFSWDAISLSGVAGGSTVSVDDTNIVFDFLNGGGSSFFNDGDLDLNQFFQTGTSSNLSSYVSLPSVFANDTFTLKGASGIKVNSVESDGELVGVALDTGSGGGQGVAPTVSINPVDGNNIVNNAEANASGGVPLSGAVTGLVPGVTFTLTLTDGTFSKAYTATVGSNRGWTATIPASDASMLANGTATVSAQAADANGGISTLASETVTVAETLPTVTAIAESPASGDLDAGKTVALTLTMSEAVTVTGAPALELNDGAAATYNAAASTATSLVFDTTVAAGQNVSELMATGVNPNGGSIEDRFGNAANLSVSGLTQTGRQIDTTAPTVATVSVKTPSVTLTTGKVEVITLTTSEAVIVKGKPVLTLNDGGTAKYVTGSGTDKLTFDYTVASGQKTPDLAITGIENAASLTDGAGNPLNTAGAKTTLGVAVNDAITISGTQSNQISGKSAQSVTFASGAAGELILVNSQEFSGTISGLTAGDEIDLRDIAFGTHNTIGYSGNVSRGVLTVSNGTHVASLTLMGDYIASSFVEAGDGHGGTLITDPTPATHSASLSVPAH